MKWSVQQATVGQYRHHLDNWNRRTAPRLLRWRPAVDSCQLDGEARKDMAFSSNDQRWHLEATAMNNSYSTALTTWPVTVDDCIIRWADVVDWDDCSLLGANSNQWRPVKYIITIQPPMVINRAQETFIWRYSFSCGHRCGNFTGRAHGRMNTPYCALCPCVM